MKDDPGVDKPPREPTVPTLHDPRAGRRRDWLAIGVMIVAVIVVYLPPSPADNQVQMGWDYLHLHRHRMQFAREALLGPAHSLPAWYPRELLGTPFRANLQSFPFIPNRLLILLAFDPFGPYAFPAAITLAAILAALFTYLYCRRIGLSATASATAGWTFAACGYFASRAAVGHLPLLEAFGALPLLLWTVESLVQARQAGRSAAMQIIVLTISSGCVMLAGHPQLPVYAMIVAAVYAICRSGFPAALLPLASMITGVGLAAFSLMPMAMLTARSTRILPLAQPVNDLAMPYGRLLGLLFPWFDGAPTPLAEASPELFHGYPSANYFWDTVCYAGWAPWLAIGVLLFAAAARKRVMPPRVAVFIAMMGIAGTLLALPIWQDLMAALPGTILRSPARLVYLSDFALAIALAAGVDRLMRGELGHLPRVLVPVLLLGHAIDLYAFDRCFVLRVDADTYPTAAQAALLKARVGEDRAGIDCGLLHRFNRSVDDVGFFDSIMLARPYRFLLDLSNAPPDLNIQLTNASQFSARALEAAGTRYLLTKDLRGDLPVERRIGPYLLYGIQHPAPRAGFFGLEQVRYLSRDEIAGALRDPQTDITTTLLLPPESRPLGAAPQVMEQFIPAKVAYRRPDSDHIECTVTSDAPGFLRVIESWDPGWSATIDGSRVQVHPALDALLAVALPPGRHEVRFVYHTPGALTGIGVSSISIVMLAGLVWIAQRRRGAQGGIIATR